MTTDTRQREGQRGALTALVRVAGQPPALVVGVVERRACSSGKVIEEARTVLYVLPPEFLTEVKEGTRPELPAEARFAPAADESLLAFTCFNGDDDRDEELAVLLLGQGGARCGDDVDDIPSTPELGARVAVVSMAQGATGAVVTYAELSSAEVDSLDSPGLDVTPLRGLAAGDVDGDGVDDLVVGAARTTLVLKGRPVNP